ncbi:MAG: Crp/Fnr family transcriptional regulator [Mucilaginibacter sp.]
MKDNLLTHIRKFISLTLDEADQVAASVQEINVQRKKFLLQPANVCRANYFVSKGCMRLYFINRNGQEQITQFGIENWWITDYDSLETGKPSHYYIQAIEDAEIISLGKAVMEELLQKVPAMERYFRLILQKAHTASMRRFEYLRDQSDEERYRLFVSAFPGFVQRVPQYMLASYLGFTPQFLSKLRAKDVRRIEPSEIEKK